ncbi:MAG: hypothetical protein K6G30_10120, partial [Acetatifactor sp.]|nr:hypothetical protein [Acetatifactor sp.]
CIASSEPGKKGVLVGNRLCHAMNDMVDLMAKAELKHKNDGKRSARFNKPLVHLLPCRKADGSLEYRAFADNKSDIMEIYDINNNSEKRRKITRDFCDRLMPVIDKARA